ncbi:MAG: BamA/TamA family outer membrane protein [Candidatus Binataceae bacterium]|jgi:hypothetical protein
MRASKLIVGVFVLALYAGIAHADSTSSNSNSANNNSSVANSGTTVANNSSGWLGGDSWLNPTNWPPDLQWLNPHTWPFSLIPIPIVVTDPNAGTTIGVMPVFLFNDSNHHISSILAPDINDNTNMGAGADFRYLSYPSADTQWYVIGGISENIARHVDLRYATGRTHQSWWSFEGRFFFERDPTERFFGLGNDSRPATETNYTTEQVYGDAKLGLNLSSQLQIALEEKPRYVHIETGALSHTLPFIGTTFPTLKGVGGGSEWMHRLLISYDTRDSVDIPTSGSLARLFTGIVDRRLSSSVSYTQFGGELRHYIPISSSVILAGHFYLQYTPAGNETPFWAMGRLGGEESLLADQQTLRGYGTGRFVDNNLSVGNLEVRIRVFEATIFDTHGILELAPFGEAGRVFHTPRADPFDELHPVGGLGVRAIADPFVVGYVDFGLGGEGASVFTGIDYPF